MILKFSDVELDICDSLVVTFANNRITVTQKTTQAVSPTLPVAIFADPERENTPPPYISCGPGPWGPAIMPLVYHDDIPVEFR